MREGLARMPALLTAAIRGRSFVAAVAKNFGIRIVLLAVNVGTGIIVARALAPSGRGEQAAIVLWPVLIAALSTFGIPTALNYTARRMPQASGRLYFVAAAISIAVGFVVAALGALVVPRLLHGYSESILSAARWLMLFIPQFLLIAVIRAYLESCGEFTRSILGQLSPAVCTLVGLAALGMLHHLTPETAALCYCVPGAVLTVWLVIRLWPRLDVSLDHVVDDAWALLSYGLRSYGTDVITALASQLDMAVIVAFLNPVALGIYSVSLSLARLLALVPQSLIMVLFPHASGLDADDAVALVARASRLSTALSIVIGSVMILTVPVLLPLVYGRSFSQAVTIMPLLIAEQIIVGLSMVLSQAFLATGRPAVVTLFQAGWLATALGCLVVLVPRMNVAGAAVALLAASTIRLGMIFAAYWLLFDRAVPRLLPELADLEYVRATINRFRGVRNTAFAD